MIIQMWTVSFSNRRDPVIVKADSRNAAKVIAIKKARGIFSYVYQEQNLISIRKISETFNVGTLSKR